MRIIRVLGGKYDADRWHVRDIAVLLSADVLDRAHSSIGRAIELASEDHFLWLLPARPSRGEGGRYHGPVLHNFEPGYHNYAAWFSLPGSLTEAEVRAIAERIIAFCDVVAEQQIILEIDARSEEPPPWPRKHVAVPPKVPRHREPDNG